MASTLSFLASSTNPQVFTMIASASSCSSVTSKPLAKRSPSMTSPSTVFFGHPRETMDTFARCFSPAEGAVSLPSDGGDMAARGALLLLAAANERRRALAVDAATDAPDRAARLPRMDAADMTLGSRVSLEVWTAREASCPCHSCCTELRGGAFSPFSSSKVPESTSPASPCSKEGTKVHADSYKTCTKVRIYCLMNLFAYFISTKLPQ